MPDLPKFPNVSWSKSRQNIYDTCPLQYYFKYYESWQGWNKNADERKRKAYFWSKRNSIPMWKGQLIHDGVARILHGESVDDVRTQLSVSIKKDWETSLKRGGMLLKYGLEKGPLKNQHPKDIILLEHTQPDFPEDVVDDIEEEVMNAVDVFSNLDQLEEYRLSASKGLYSFSEDPNAAFTPLTVPFVDARSGDEVKVWSMLDCAYEVEPGQFLIYDWKTGNLPTDVKETYLTDQLIIYALYLKNIILKDRPNVSIEAYELYLKKDVSAIGGPVSDYELDVRVQDIAGKVSEAKQLHEAIGERGQAACKATPSRSTCKHCQFQYICDDRYEE